MTAKKRMGQCQKDGSRCETATVRYEWCGEALDRLTVYGVKGHKHHKVRRGVRPG